MLLTKMSSIPEAPEQPAPPPIRRRQVTHQFATDEDLAFLRNLRLHAGKTLNANEMVALIGAENSAGLGSKLGWTCKRLEKDGYRIRDYFLYTRDEENKSRWQIIKGLETE